MAKTAVTQWSATRASNSDIDGINIAEGCPAGNLNDAVRELMVQLAESNAGTAPVADTWTFADPADLTKRVRLDAGNVTAGETRVLTMPDANILIPSEKYTLVTGEKTILATERGQFFRKTGSAATWAPQAAATCGDGWYVTIRVEGSVLTIDPEDSEAVDGALTASIPPGSTVVLRCNGTEFYIDRMNDTTPWVNYTPTLTGFGTPSVVEVASRRVGSSLEVKGRFTSGTSTAVLGAVQLGFNGVSGGLVISSVFGASRFISGQLAVSYTVASAFYTLGLAGEDNIKFSIVNSTRSGFDPVDGSVLLASGDSLFFSASVPISGWN